MSESKPKKQTRNDIERFIDDKMGWKLKVDPEIMSHPANCEFLLDADNIHKSDRCSVTLSDLYQGIQGTSNVIE